MRRSLKNIAVAAVVAFLAVFVFISKEDLNFLFSHSGTSSQKAEFAEAVRENKVEFETANVIKVLDGDTFVIENGEEVRLIGIDAPELSQPYARESKDFLKGLILNKQVKLEKDNTDRDRYNRLLRYVYLDDMFVNLKMVFLGYANIYSYPPDTKYESEIINAEEKAKEAGRGFWQENVMIK